MTPAELLLQDWGRPALLRQTNAAYDPATGLLSENPADTSLRVIPGPSDEVCQPETSALAPRQAQTFLVATSELPDHSSVMGSQLICDERHYAIHRIEASPIPLLSLLHCLSLS
jgi:hypothetical protein